MSNLNENDIFSEGEYSSLQSIINNDVETLRKKGKVSFTKSEKNGVITETLIFTDANGSNTFTRTVSYNKNDALYKVIQEINKKMDLAINVENYEKAAKLKKQKEELLFNKA